MSKAPEQIRDIFLEDIHRNIEEVIKVDNLDDRVLVEEIREYHPTPSIQEQMAEILEAYSDSHRAETQDVGVWISGFFGAGKSSFAKLLGILLQSRAIGDKDAIELFSRRISDQRIKVLLSQIRENLPTHVVIFDILKDNIAGAKEFPVTTVMYKALLRSLGYPNDLSLAELAIQLEQRGELDQFIAKYNELFAPRNWEQGKLLTMTAMNEASRVLHELEPETYQHADSWARSRPKTEVTPRILAERAISLAKARAGGKNVVFVVDEIGQYTARDLTRIGDLQGVVESFSLFGSGKLWLIATAQEKLEAIVDIYEKDRSDLVRLRDRFSHQVDIKSTDIREVASHRVLSKNASAETQLRKLYDENSGKLKMNTSVTSTVPLPELTEDDFVRLYPLLPYQIDLLIAVVSGLRRQGSGPQTMGGANRTIIKLAQQLIIHERSGLSSSPIGALVTFDSVYELIVTNISTEIQQEIDTIDDKFGLIEGRIARALVLLQFSDQAHVTEENIAAVLHPSVGGTSLLSDVRAGIDTLISARKIRRTEHGLKIQSAAERTWDEERDSRQPTPAERIRIVKEVLAHIWGKGPTQQPAYQMGGSKRFTAGLKVGNEVLVDGDVPFEVRLLDPASSAEDQFLEARQLTQQTSQDGLVAWCIELSDEAEDAIRERFRSDRMIERGVRTREEEVLLRDEGRRKHAADAKLRDEIARALCRGRLFFRGNDRSPDDEAADPKTEARRVLGPALDQIFHRFGDGDVKLGTKDVEAILTSENLAGLPSCYSDLRVVQTKDGQTRLVTDQGAAKEVFDWVRLRCDGGQAPSGREAEQHFKAAPYGWGLELVQLVVAVLLREGQITLRASSQQLKQALTPEAKKAITNNTAFRALSIGVRESILDPKKLRDAGKTLEQGFGVPCPSLTVESIAGTVRQHLGSEIPILEQAHGLLRELQLPGKDSIEQGLSTLRAIERGDDEDVIQLFLESADTLKKAIARGRGVEQSVTEPAREVLERARAAHQKVGPVLARETEADDPARDALTKLHDLLESETFFEHLPAIESATATVLDRFQTLYDEAFASRRQAYVDSLGTLSRASGWSELEEEDKAEVARRLLERSTEDPLDEPWRLAATILGALRDQTDAAKGLLGAALEALRKRVTPEAVEINVQSLLSGPISSQEELDAALTAIREEVERALAEGKPVVLT